MNKTVIGRSLEFARGGEQGNQAAATVIVKAINKSGGALAVGDTVIYDTTNSTADLIAVTTTASGDNRLAYGIAREVIANNTVGDVQIWGPTSFLKVNGTTDIAVGDYLSTFTTAKIAQKTTGAGAFAMALEAYTGNDSNGVIDAFIMTMGMVPRPAS